MGLMFLCRLFAVSLQCLLEAPLAELPVFWDLPTGGQDKASGNDPLQWANLARPDGWLRVPCEEKPLLIIFHLQDAGCKCNSATKCDAPFSTNLSRS